MPWHVGRSAQCPESKPWAVIKDSDGSVSGCHASRTKANRQLAALYANETIGRSGARVRIQEKGYASERLLDIAEAVQPGSRYVLALRQAHTAEAGAMELDLRRDFSQLGEHVAGAARSVNGLVVAQEAVTDAERQRIDLIVAAAALKTWTGDRLGRTFRKHYRITAKLVLDRLSREGLEIGERQRVMDRILKEGGRRLGLLDIGSDTRRALFEVLEKARAEGLGPRAVARQIKEMVPAGRFVNAGSGYRSSLIARTEMMHAQRVATLEAVRADPRVNTVVAFDGDGDPECIARNGNTYTVDAAWGQLGDTHPQCVLSFAPAT